MLGQLGAARARHFDGEGGAADTAERDHVEVRLYTVIYDAKEDMKKAMEGLLEPTIREVRLGAAEVRDTFKISKIGTIAGCGVTDGLIRRQAKARLGQIQTVPARLHRPHRYRQIGDPEDQPGAHDHPPQG